MITVFISYYNIKREQCLNKLVENNDKTLISSMRWLLYKLLYKI